MTKRFRTIILVTVGIVFTISPIAANAQTASSPSLAETMAFIKQTLVSYGSVQATVTNGATQTDVYSLNQVNGCLVDITQDSTWHFTNGLKDMKSVRTYHVSLSSLDPASIAPSSYDLTKDPNVSAVVGSVIGISTINNAKTIGSSLNGRPEDGLGSSISIGASSSDELNRLSKAFAHAITLCGGKPSAF